MSFQEFKGQAGEVQEPPRALSERILGQVSSDLNPSAWKVFARLSGVHLGVSLVTLSVCPQFGFRTLGEGMGLMHLFMEYGPTVCAMACGAFFLGLSALAGGLLLRPEELRVIRRSRGLQLGALALLSQGALIMLGAEDVVLGFAIAWLAGSLLAGMGALELSLGLRRAWVHAR